MLEMQSRLLIWHVFISIVAADYFGLYVRCTIIGTHIIEVLIFIYLSFVRLLLYNKHLIDV